MNTSISKRALGGTKPQDIMTRLRERGISAGAQVRAFALLDYDDKGVAASLRLSPHYYNTEEEVDEAVSTLRDLMS